MNSEKNGLPRTIVFDAVGTLIRPLESISQVYHRFGLQLGMDLDQSTVKRRFTEARKLFFSNDPDQPSSDRLEKQRWSRLVQFVFEQPTELTSLFHDLWDYYSVPEHWMLFPEVPGCLEQLWSQGFSISIGSNFDGRLVEICRHLPPLDRIKNVFYSGQLGFCKPDRRFYDEIVRRLKMDDDSVMDEDSKIGPLMIGDDFAKDVVAARQAGWSARHLDRPSRDLAQLLFGH